MQKDVLLRQSSPIAIANRRIRRMLSELPPEKLPEISRRPTRLWFSGGLRLPLLLCIALTFGGVINFGYQSGIFGSDVPVQTDMPRPGLFVRCPICDKYQYNVKTVQEAFSVMCSEYAHCRDCHSPELLQIGVCCPKCGRCYSPTAKVNALDVSPARNFSCSISAVCPNCGNKYMERSNLYVSEE